MLGDIQTIIQEHISISELQFRFYFSKTGADETKYLTFYRATSNTVSGSIASMRGSLIGAIPIPHAYNSSPAVILDSETNAEVFANMVSYFQSGGEVLIIYVPTTRGTHSSGYCYDYLQITDVYLRVVYDKLYDTGSMNTSPIVFGSQSTMTIQTYDERYYHQVTWSLGDNSHTVTVPAGTLTASYTVPLSWLAAIPSSLSGTGTVTLSTYDWNDRLVGTNTYSCAYAAPDSVVPTIGSLNVQPVNSNSAIANWGLYVYGKSQARITINGAAGAYGSTIVSYSIETDPGIGSASASTLLTGILYKTGTVTVTARVTDSRGRTATATQTLYIHPYSAPVFNENTAYRCTSGGVRDDVNGTYAYLKSVFAYSALDAHNSVTANVLLKQVGGGNIATQSIASDTAYILGGWSLVSDAAYQITITLTDAVGSVTTYSAEIPSAAYIMHIKKGGKAVGFGMAAGADQTISFGWPVKLSTPLEVSQGGTGGSTAAAACAALGAVKKTGDTMTGDLSIESAQFPSLFLKPTANGTTNRAVVEGSYLGAASIAAREDSTGYNQRRLEIRNAAYETGMDNALLLRTTVNDSWNSFRVFHAGMATPIPISSGGTGGATAKAALNSLGIFFASTLPDSGTDGQICRAHVVKE